MIMKSLCVVKGMNIIMEYKDVYTNFNDFYYDRLKDIINDGNRYIDFLKEIREKNIDLTKVIYIKLIDEDEEIKVNSKQFRLLPMGIKNNSIPSYFIEGTEMKVAGKYGNLNVFKNMFLHETQWVSLYYHSKNQLKQVFQKVCNSYIEHYRKNLNEVWSEKDFYSRLLDLKYLSVKYAEDLETGEIFAIGFFGTLEKNSAGGKALTDAELYVMPEFRNMGIAKRMVGLTFELAKTDGIENFDSITYRVQSCDALSFWERIGALVTGLTHIEGNISEIIEIISSKKNKSL